MENWVPQTKAVIGGVKRLLVAAFNATGRPAYTGAPVRINDLDPVPAWAAVVLDHPAGGQASQVGGPTVNGGQLQQKLTLPFSGLSAAQRNLLEELSARPMWALVEDYAGQWWWLGQRRGLRYAGLSTTTGANQQTQEEVLELAGREPEAWRQIFGTRATIWLNAALGIEGGDDGGGGEEGGGEGGS